MSLCATYVPLPWALKGGRPGVLLHLAGSGLSGSGLPVSCSAFSLLHSSLLIPICSTRASVSPSPEVEKEKFRKCPGLDLVPLKPVAGPWHMDPWVLWSISLQVSSGTRVPGGQSRSLCHHGAFRLLRKQLWSPFGLSS